MSNRWRRFLPILFTATAMMLWVVGCGQGNRLQVNDTGSDEEADTAIHDTGNDKDKDTLSPDTGTDIEEDTGQSECVDGSTRTCGKSDGICEKGEQECTDGTWEECTNNVEPEDMESCDDKDNDCDGQVDEELDCSCTSGETQPCGKSEGVCTQGTQTCQNGSWGDCMGGTMPGMDGPPNCDSKDNDCDGQVDEGCDCQTGNTRTCGSGMGQCQKGTQECKNGQWGVCQGSVGKSNETCDGNDNDCDGKTDEGLSRPCGKNTGQCSQGTETCQNGNWSSCMGNQGPTMEMCDGNDNDCDNQTDEGLSRSCGQGTGQCQPGTESCQNGSWTSCMGSQGPSNEMCDGNDNDCDGQIDEVGPRSCGTSTGQCQEGQEKCSSGSWGSCSGKVGPSPEICDDLDNDCDGQTDNDPAESEDFEGNDPEWSKFVDGSNSVTVDADHTGTTSSGQQSAHAKGSTGICGNAGGIARDFKLKGDPDFLKMDIKAKGDSYARANVMIKTSNGYKRLWEEKGGGSGLDVGWTTETFDISSLAGKKFKLIIGNADDSSPHCQNRDHSWKVWADNIELQYRKSIDFEKWDFVEPPVVNESEWDKFSTGDVSSKFSATDDAEDASRSGTESAKMSGDRGSCGTAAGISRTYSFPSTVDELEFYYKAKTKNWGRVTVMLKDSSGWHKIMEEKAGGSALNTGWRRKTINLSQYDNDFRLVFGNNDDNAQHCDNRDHGWTMWIDDVDVSTACP